MKGFQGTFENFRGNMVLSGFDTEHDLNLAIKALERLCLIMSEESLYDINKFLESYRRKCAKMED